MLSCFVMITIVMIMIIIMIFFIVIIVIITQPLAGHFVDRVSHPHDSHERQRTAHHHHY